MAELIILSDYIEKLQSILESDPDAAVEIGNEWNGFDGEVAQSALVSWNPEKAHEAKVISDMNRIADEFIARREQEAQDNLLAMMRGELDASVRRHPAGKGKTSIWPVTN